MAGGWWQAGGGRRVVAGGWWQAGGGRRVVAGGWWQAGGGRRVVAGGWWLQEESLVAVTIGTSHGGYEKNLLWRLQKEFITQRIFSLSLIKKYFH